MLNISALKKIIILCAILSLAGGCTFSKASAAKQSLTSVGESAGSLNEESKASKDTSEKLREYENTEKLNEYKW